MISTQEARLAMGRALSSLGRAEGATGVVTDNYWYGFSGSPAVDWNLAVIYSADATEVQTVVDVIAESGLPVLVMLAGDAAETELPALTGWTHAAAMPIMAIEAPFPGAARDPRVRQATAADFDQNVAVVSAAFGMQPEGCVEPLRQIFDENVPLETWVLEQDGILVSSVVASFDGTIGSVWCMATPPEQQRKG